MEENFTDIISKLDKEWDRLDEMGVKTGQTVNLVRRRLMNWEISIEKSDALVCNEVFKKIHELQYQIDEAFCAIKIDEAQRNYARELASEYFDPKKSNQPHSKETLISELNAYNEKFKKQQIAILQCAYELTPTRETVIKNKLTGLLKELGAKPREKTIMNLMERPKKGKPQNKEWRLSTQAIPT